MSFSNNQGAEIAKFPLGTFLCPNPDGSSRVNDGGTTTSDIVVDYGIHPQQQIKDDESSD